MTSRTSYRLVPARTWAIAIMAAAMTGNQRC
jgi:hypothetical protein